MKHETQSVPGEEAPVDSDRPAFVICNDRGEVFQWWACGVSVGPSGCGESTYSVPTFGKQRTHVASPGQLVPAGVEYGETYRTGDPHVFYSRKAAEKSMARMFGFYRLAIVEVPGKVRGISDGSGEQK